MLLPEILIVVRKTICPMDGRCDVICLLIAVNCLMAGHVWGDSQIHDREMEALPAESVTLFICKSGGALNIRLICDGRLDCYDGSDELRELCYRTLCPAGKFRCYYGACIDKSRKCNGIRDCADGSDEEQCGRGTYSCPSHEFRCQYGKCIPISLVCDGNTDCLDNTDELNDMCDNLQVCPAEAFKCNYGGCVPKSAQCDGFLDCIDGSDESTVLCLAIECPKCRQNVKCRPITSFRLDVHCEHNGFPVSCYQPIVPGSRVHYSCKQYFVPENSRHEYNFMAECQLDGTWSREILQCKPDCGRLSSAVPLVVKGWQVHEPFPWHVSIYIRQGDENRFWCGATLITEAVVITAAHCVWGQTLNSIVLVLGTTRSHFNETSTDNGDEFATYLLVKRIIMHPLYMDKYGNYGSDIALLEIDGMVEFNEQILPVCIDWELDDITSHLSHQSLGLVMGMGVNEENSYSERLRVTSLPVVANRKCVQKQRPDFRKFVTFTTFCAGWENGTAVCNGDSGGGLVFLTKSTDRWCLQVLHNARFV